MNTDLTTPEQSDLGPYCFQHTILHFFCTLPKKVLKQMREQTKIVVKGRKRINPSSATYNLQQTTISNFATFQRYQIRHEVS